MLYWSATVSGNDTRPTTENEKWTPKCGLKAFFALLNDAAALFHKRTNSYLWKSARSKEKNCPLYLALSSKWLSMRSVQTRNWFSLDNQFLPTEKRFQFWKKGPSQKYHSHGIPCPVRRYYKSKMLSWNFSSFIGINGSKEWDTFLISSTYEDTTGISCLRMINMYLTVGVFFVMQRGAS